ncbi:MAG: hypothetical protein WB930_00050 [Syntrophobacteraceae bacterium]
MAKYELLEKAFIHNRIWEPGETVEVDDSVIPGPHMKPLDAAAEKAFKKTGFTLGAVQQHDIVDAIASFGATPQGVKAGMTASE